MFALEEEDDQEEEMFAVVDRQQWNTQRAAEPPLSPELQQMFALARRMGYEMRLIARRFDAPRQTPGSRQSPNRDYHLNHATTPGLSVSAVVSWDTPKFVVPNRTHLFRSGQADG